MVHLIMPMAGAGIRFKGIGIEQPKPLIDLKGRPFFYWSTNSISQYGKKCIVHFIVLEDHVKAYKIDEVIRQYYPDATIKIIKRVLSGAVLTVLEGITNIDDSESIIINDCDHMFRCQALNDVLQSGDVDNFVLSFDSSNPNYSYVQYDINGNPIGTVEKRVVSKSAICGVYAFKRKGSFVRAANRYKENCSYNEYYISGVYNELINMGESFRVYKVDSHLEFGTPEEYQKAQMMKFDSM